MGILTEWITEWLKGLLIEGIMGNLEGLLSIKFLCVTLPHMSIGRCVIRAVALQQIDHAPHGKASAQCHDEGLQGSNGRSKKLHKSSISPGCSRL